MATNEYMRNWQQARKEMLNEQGLKLWLATDGFQEIKVIKGEAGNGDTPPRVVVGEGLPVRRTGYREGGHIKEFARLKKKTICPKCKKKHSEYNFYTSDKMIAKGITCKQCKGINLIGAVGDGFPREPDPRL